MALSHNVSKYKVKITSAQIGTISPPLAKASKIQQGRMSVLFTLYTKQLEQSLACLLLGK